MRVFVLCTGRNGSASLYFACKHITNYTCGHESLKRGLGASRFDFAENHIEIDNRLSWFLGTMDKNFGDEAIYVHLQRDKEKTTNSFTRRFGPPGSIINAFTEGVKHRRTEELSSEDRRQLAVDYIDTITDNIEFFLRSKSRKMDFHIEQYEADFRKFWNLIGAEGDFDSALMEFSKVHNAHRDRRFNTFVYNLKLLVISVKRLFSK